MVTLKQGKHTVSIDQGELVSYRIGKTEYMHQKGQPGWGRSDTEMFPIIGPTEKSGYRVQVPKGNAIQDQHGLLRELSYVLMEKDATSAVYSKTYKSGTLVVNSKYPERSRARQLLWPFNFQFRKRLELTGTGLKIIFTVSGDRDMPFMLGYHPAFALQSSDARVVSDHKSFSLEAVMAAGDRAVQVADTDRLVLEDKQFLELKTRGFGHFMLWSPAPNMICVEPITFYPYAAGQELLHEGFQFLGGKAMEFEVQITPIIKDDE
jgi:hypothetical protein